MKELFAGGKSGKVRPDQQNKCIRLLDASQQAVSPEDMNVPGWHFHGLHGKPKRYAVAVNGPWRITFGFDGQNVIDVDLEQYH